MITYLLLWNWAFLTLVGPCFAQSKRPSTATSPAGWHPPVLLSPKAQSPSRLVLVGDKVFFTATEYHAHYVSSQLWVTDGTPVGTRLLKKLSDNREPYSKSLTAVGKIVLFSVGADNRTDTLYRSDGTAVGTFAVTDAAAKAVGYPNDLVVIGPKVYMGCNYQSGPDFKIARSESNKNPLISLKLSFLVK